MTSPQADAARLNLALTELRLPAIKALWPHFAEQADKEGLDFYKTQLLHNIESVESLTKEFKNSDEFKEKKLKEKNEHLDST